MNTRLTRIAILLALALVALPRAVGAEIYVYRDAKGVMHFTSVPYGLHGEKVRPFQSEDLVGLAQHQPGQKPQLTRREAVAACIVIARKANNPFYGLHGMIKLREFDAYVRSSDDKVMYSGTPEDRFSFEKCMDEKGHSLE